MKKILFCASALLLLMGNAHCFLGIGENNKETIGQSELILGSNWKQIHEDLGIEKNKFETISKMVGYLRKDSNLSQMLNSFVASIKSSITFIGDYEKAKAAKTIEKEADDVQRLFRASDLEQLHTAIVPRLSADSKNHYMVMLNAFATLKDISVKNSATSIAQHTKQVWEEFMKAKAFAAKVLPQLGAAATSYGSTSTAVQPAAQQAAAQPAASRSSRGR